MKICIIGLGSIGQRHLRNVDFVLKGRGLSATFDVVEQRELDYLDAETRSLVARRFPSPAEIGEYDLAWITNPSQVHLETLRTVEGRAKHVFVEKPVFVKSVPDGELGVLADESRFTVACPMRHTRPFAWLADFVRANRVFCARAICSSYLPEWRPGTDYRRTYAAQPGSGGVKLDLVHEFDYLFALFGLPVESRLMEGKFSDLEIAAADDVSFVAKYAGMALELHLDYYGRAARREIELYTADDVAVCDFIRHEVRFLRSGARVDLAEERDDYCRREEGYFLDFALGGKPNVNSIPYANRIIRFLEGK